VLLGVLATTEDVASFRAVLPVSLTLTYVLSSFGMLFVPLASRLHARGAADELEDLYWQTAAWSALFSFPIFGLAIAFGKPLATLLFGDDYAGSGVVLAALVVGHFVTAAIGPNGSLLAVHGKVRYIVVTNVVAIAASVTLAVLLIPAFGALGAAVAGSATLVLVNVVRQTGLTRRTTIRSFDRRVFGIYAVLAALSAALLIVAKTIGETLAVGIPAVFAATGAAFVYARHGLRVGTTFPELARLPGFGALVGRSEVRK
jgi:O-antigen/teichoic acid export membrane protein